MLKCIQYAEESHDFVERLKDLRWLKTHVGFRAPHEAFLVDEEWKCLLNAVDKVPLLDLEFYGDEIRLYKEELSKRIVHDVKKLVHISSLTKERALALLECYRDLVTKHRERWLHTPFGFRAAKEAIIFSSAWKPIASVCSLPFIDDKNTQYGHGEICYRNELIALGSKVGLEQGACHLGTKSSVVPHDDSAVTPEAVISMLKCIRTWRKKGTALPGGFMSRVNVKGWVTMFMPVRCHGRQNI